MILSRRQENATNATPTDLMSEQPSQPRIDPSDWAVRRKDAMIRAQELRAKKKEVDLNHTGDVSPSPVSQSELQRQRRSRQLEATQKLLDAAGQLGGGNKTFDVISGKSNLALNPDDERPIGGSGAARRDDAARAHSSVIASQKQLGQIPRQYETSIENLTSSLQNARLVGNESKKEILQPSVGEMPLEGRGRGRGRGRSSNVSSITDVFVGDVLIPRISSASSKGGGEVVVDIKSSRSSITTGTHSSNSSESIHSRSRRESVDDVVSSSLQSYLKGRLVPEFKEGDCTKLTNLRQRLVARRRKRGMLSNTLGGAAPIGRVIQSSQSRRSVGSSSSSTREGATERSGHTNPSRFGGNSRATNQDLRSLENQAGLNPNDYTARDFQQSRETNTRYQESDAMVTSSPPVSTPESNDDGSTDEKSNDDGSAVVANNDDDEASVVDIELIQCDNCKRKFAPKIYDKHYNNGQPRCIQMAVTRRPVYNAKAVRIGNNATLDQKDQMLANHAPYGDDAAKSSSKRKGGNKKNSKWREESEAFREALRANRLVSQEETMKKKKEKRSVGKKHGKSRKSKA